MCWPSIVPDLEQSGLIRLGCFPRLSRLLDASGGVWPEPSPKAHERFNLLVKGDQMPRSFKPYGYAWVTLRFFLISIVGHWIFGWFAYADEQLAHGADADGSGYVIEMMRDTLENWQSEFLQLLWQVGGLAFLLFLGSPQSKEGTDRMEAKLDAILRRVDPHEGEQVIADIDAAYLGRHTDEPHGHGGRAPRERE